MLKSPKRKQLFAAGRSTALEVPDCLIIGPQKAGTSWIHHYLQTRGDVAVPQNVKETFFFDRRFERGLQWYSRHFHAHQSTRRIVEVAPSYFHHEMAAQRIFDSLGTMRLICTLREPVARAYSLYLHGQRYGGVDVSFRQAVKDNPVLLQSSMYATLLRRWMDVFGKDNISVLLLEDLARDPQTYATKLCESLGLPFTGIDEAATKPVNAATVPPNRAVARIGKAATDVLRYWGWHGVVESAKQLGLKPLFFGSPLTRRPPPISVEDRHWLAGQLEDEICRLEDMIDLDLSAWRAGASQRAA